MRKSAVLSIILLLVLAIFIAGCAGEEKGGKKLVSSRPIQAEQRGGPSAGTPVAVEQPVVTEGSVTQEAEESTPVPVAGKAFCEQLSTSEIGSVFTGTWSKISGCPVHPAMPKGVDVCQCSYDGPGQLYVDVETQLYTKTEEAERVYNMYCSGTAEENEVGDASCRVQKLTSTRPNFVYFLKGNYFVKVSCLGGPCPLDAVAELAKQVDAEI